MTKGMSDVIIGPVCIRRSYFLPAECPAIELDPKGSGLELPLELREKGVKSLIVVGPELFDQIIEHFGIKEVE